MALGKMTLNRIFRFNFKVYLPFFFFIFWFHVGVQVRNGPLKFSVRVVTNASTRFYLRNKNEEAFEGLSALVAEYVALSFGGINAIFGLSGEMGRGLYAPAVIEGILHRVFSFFEYVDYLS